MPTTQNETNQNSPEVPMTKRPTSSTGRSSLTRIGAVAIGAALALAACGSGGDVPLTEAAAQPTTAAEPQVEATPARQVAAATIGDSDLGPILAGDNGLTLYGFTNDVEAASTCYGTCADAWPPVIVDADFSVAPGLDVGIFATTERDDGTLQLVAGKWPLYFFAGDATPGDLAGQGSGDVWFVVDLDGKLITDDATAEVAGDDSSDQADQAASPAPVTTAESDLGPILVDAQGLSLYGFTEDGDGTPTCEGACADAWPPVVVDSADLPEGLDAEVFSVVERPDGTLQLKAGKWPLYTFAGDGAPGDINGQGSGDVWFLADPAGGLIKGDGASGDTSADDGASTGDDTDEDDDY